MVLLGSFRQALVSHRVVTRGDMIQGCLSCSVSWGQPCPLPKDEGKCTACSLPSSCMSPPSLLTKTKLNGTSAQFTELPAVTAGERSYLSVPLPFCHRDRRLWCTGKANSGGSVLSSRLLVKPQRWWTRALAGRQSRFLGLITATSSDSLPVIGIWLFSDHPALSESVRWSQTLRKPRSERHSWTRRGRKNCPKTADRPRAQH